MWCFATWLHLMTIRYAWYLYFKIEGVLTATSTPRRLTYSSSVVISSLAMLCRHCSCYATDKQKSTELNTTEEHIYFKTKKLENHSRTCLLVVTQTSEGGCCQKQCPMHGITVISETRENAQALQHVRINCQSRVECSTQWPLSQIRSRNVSGIHS